MSGYNTPNKCMLHRCERSCTCGASTSLVALETSVHDATQMNAVQYRFFRGLSEERDRILKCLVHHDHGQLEKRIRRVSSCSSAPRVMRMEDGTAALAVGRCRDRMCPRCSRVNAYQCSEKLSALMKKMTSKRAITLTIKNGRGLLHDQINSLMNDWREIRRSPVWKERVVGGVYSLEVTYDSVKKTWHPHLHIIVQGEYFPQKELSDLWRRVTGNSPIVYIQAVHDTEKMGRYISKYVTKPDEVSQWPEAVLWEYMEAIRGRRLFHTFGCMHNVKVCEKPEKSKEAVGMCYSPIHMIIKGAECGISECELVLMALSYAPKSWRVAFNVPDLFECMDSEEEDGFNAKQMAELMDAATTRLKRPPAPTKPPPRQELTLF